MDGEDISLRITEEKLRNIRVTAPFYKNKLNLPDYLRFGFEIEALIDEDKIKNDMIRANNQDLFDNAGFRGVSEMISFEENEYGGVDNCEGGEIVTPILTDSEESWLDVKKACEYLENNGRVTSYCSVHTNIGAESLGSNYSNWYNFCKIIAACEPEIYRYLSNGDEIRYCAISGGFRSGFAMPIANVIRNGLEKSSEENVRDINTLLNNCKFGGDYQYKKDKSISLKGIYRNSTEIISPEELEKSIEGRRIEFRMANGTFSPIQIQSQLYLIGRIIETSRNLTPQKNELLDELLSKPLPTNYNSSPDISRVLDVANILFDSKEDKLQFLFTMCKRKKTEKTSINNKDELMRFLKKGNIVLKFASDDLKKDREVVLEAIKHGGAQIQYASEDLRADKTLGLLAVQKYGRALQYLSEDLRKDRQIVLEAIKNNGCALEYAHEDLKKDKELILEAIKNRKSALKYADEQTVLDKDFFATVYGDNEIVHNYLESQQIDDEEQFFNQIQKDEIIYKYFLQEALDGNEEVKKYILKYLENVDCQNWRSRSNENAMVQKRIVLETLEKIRSRKDSNFLLSVIETNPSLFEYLEPKEQNNKQIALIALESNAEFLEYLGPKLKADKQIGLVAVKKNGDLLEHLGKALRGDPEVVLEAVKTGNFALAYASDALKADEAIVLEAVKHNGNALRYADKKLKGNRDIVLQAVTTNGSALANASDELKKDKNIVLIAVQSGAWILKYADSSLQEDPDIIISLLKTRKTFLNNLSENLRANRAVVLEAIKVNPYAIQHASGDLKKDKELTLVAVGIDGTALSRVDEELRKDREVVLTAVQSRGSALEYACENFRKDRNIVFEAVKNNGYALQYADETLRRDRQIVLTAFMQDKNSLKYAVPELSKDRAWFEQEAEKLRKEGLEFPKEATEKRKIAPDPIGEER